MKEYLNSNRTANSVRQLRQTYEGVFIIVEGLDDKKFFGMFVDRNSCKFEIAEDKEKALEALDILNRGDFQGAVAILDYDFLGLEDIKPEFGNLFFTDTHDIETMILKTRALNTLITNYDVNKILSLFSVGIRKKLLQICKWIGYLRLINEKESLGLAFKRKPKKESNTRYKYIAYKEFVDLNSFTINEKQMIKTVKNFSKKPALDVDHYLDKIRKMNKNKYDHWHLCCGHDLTNVLAIILNKIKSRLRINYEMIESDLRLAYEESYFKKTQLFKSLLQWESNNQPFKIF
jgi:hypothetical protein